MSDDKKIPPFPASSLPTAKIHTIDFDLLSKNDPDQSRQVFEAATGYGFFYLLNHHVDHDFMFSLADSIFNLPLEEKMKYDMGSTGHYYGYKRRGGFIVDDKGTPDASEFYNISKDEVLGIPNPAQNNSTKSTPHPPCVKDDFPQLAQFMRSCHKIVEVIVRALGRELGLEESLLPSMHQVDKPSCCQARVTHAPPITPETVALGDHSDFGSVTVLFNKLGGLQVLNPYQGEADGGDEEWKYVPPHPDAAIINLGDSLIKLCGHRLYSAVHRVMGPPKPQDHVSRHSVVYFARPNSDVMLRSLFEDEDRRNGVQNSGKKDGEEEEEVMNADDWVARRARTWASANFRDKGSYLASRGTEHNAMRERMRERQQRERQQPVSMDRPPREIEAV